MNVVSNLGMENFLQFYKHSASGFIVSEANTGLSVKLTVGKSLIFAPANRFEGIQEGANATMSRTADGLKIHVLNNDPNIFLPGVEGVTPANKVTVHVQLVSPGQTIIRIFYSTSAVGEFDQAHL